MGDVRRQTRHDALGLGMDDPVVSESRFYLPGMGLHLLLATALMALGNRHPIAAWLRMGVPALFLILTFGRGQDYRSEISLWEETARSSPHKPRVHYELARAYLNAGSADPAEKALAITLRLDSKHVPALVKLGEIYIQQKEYAKALNAYNELMRQGIKVPEVRFNSGLALLALKRPKEAVPYLEEAVSRQPGSADWQLTLARAYHQSRRLQNALNHYRSTLQINPDQPVAHNEMGLVFWDLKSYFFADASFQKAYQLDPRYIDALNNLISSSMLFKQYDQTITYLNRLLEIHPKDDNAHQLLVAARRFQKQQESARRPRPTISIKPHREPFPVVLLIRV
ncbi:MAG: tetratricopeptide repeat protein [Nitrospinae bacterium]|nr:tetratricopeptide repeat protein [Nitrospinota bacterium]